jgi:hypothetical protein
MHCLPRCTKGSCNLIAMVVPVGATHPVPDWILSCGDRKLTESLDSKNGSPLPQDDGSSINLYHGFAIDGITRSITAVTIAGGATRHLLDRTLSGGNYLPDMTCDCKNGSPLQDVHSIPSR